MKKIFIYLFLLFLSLSVPSYAEEIKDLEIEGISIGDSLLDHLTKEEIIKELEINKIQSYHYLSDKFGEVYIFSNKFKNYDYVSFFVKPSDGKYIIYSIYGTIAYNENINECYEKQKKIGKEFSLIYSNARKIERELVHKVDPSGKSTIRYIYFQFNNGDLIRVECTKFEKSIKKKNNWDNGLSVSLSKKSVQDWFSSSN